MTISADAKSVPDVEMVMGYFNDSFAELREASAAQSLVESGTFTADSVAK